MSETLRKLWDGVAEEMQGNVLGPFAINEFLDRYGAYHIIPGADAVVTPQGLEDAADAVLEQMYPNTPNAHPTQAYHIARAAIETAGIEVVDEVYRGVVVTGSEVGPCARCDRWDVPVEPLDIADGDTIFIKRATTGKEE